MFRAGVGTPKSNLAQGFLRSIFLRGALGLCISDLFICSVFERMRKKRKPSMTKGEPQWRL
jgi:hypothetical protein